MGWDWEHRGNKTNRGRSWFALGRNCYWNQCYIMLWWSYILCPSFAFFRKTTGKLILGLNISVIVNSLYVLLQVMKGPTNSDITGSLIVKLSPTFKMTLLLGWLVIDPTPFKDASCTYFFFNFNSIIVWTFFNVFVYFGPIY